MDKKETWHRNKRVTSLAKILDQVVKRYQLDQKVNENQVIIKWQEIVGPRFAAVTEPIRVKNGILYVKVKSDSWRNEVHFQKLEILHNIEAFMKSRIVTEIIFL